MTIILKKKKRKIHSSHTLHIYTNTKIKTIIIIKSNSISNLQKEVNFSSRESPSPAYLQQRKISHKKKVYSQQCQTKRNPILREEENVKKRSVDELGDPPNIRRGGGGGGIQSTGERILLAEPGVHDGPEVPPGLDPLHRRLLLPRGGAPSPEPPRRRGRGRDLERPDGGGERARGRKPGALGRRVVAGGGRAEEAELGGRVGEEADAAATGKPVLARLGPVPRRVEPALENAVSELAGVAAATRALAEVRAGGAGVVVAAGVAAAGLLAGVRERALRPVVGPATRAPPDLELEHAEVVARVRVGDGVRVVGDRVVGDGGKEAVERRVVGERGRHVAAHGVVPLKDRNLDRRRVVVVVVVVVHHHHRNNSRLFDSDIYL